MSKNTVVTCKQCGGTMSPLKKVDKSLTLQLVGVLVFIVGVLLLFVFPVGTVFGIILMVVATRLGYSKKKVWKCDECGYFFEYTK